MMTPFNPGVHVLYIDTDYVALAFSGRKSPVLVQRNQNRLEEKEVNKILDQIKLTTDGIPFQKENGCWCLNLKERDNAQGNDNL